jgi:hypothetical protein
MGLQHTDRFIAPFYDVAVAGATAGLRSPFHRWYIEYFLQLIAPHGTLPDFGDGEWRSTWLPYVPCFELAAREAGARRVVCASSSSVS